METKINIAAILESKPQGIKLYSLTYGDCSYQGYTGDFGIECQSQNGVQFNLDEYGKYCIDGECILFPSKEMRDWNKFAWKKGDVLVNSRGLKILFDRWANDNYTSFYAKTINLVEDAFLDTNLHTLASEKEAKSFVKCIEEKLGGKLNLESLEIEKQPEFKDGDILYTEKDESHTDGIFILKTVKGKRGHYACLILHPYRMCNYSRIGFIGNKTLRYATKEEQQQLFDALAKEGKAWDSEKKQIVDLKPKIELKPFDKVLVRDSKSDYWRANLFGYIDKNGYFRCVYTNWAYCIPYAGNEQLLGTTKDV